MEPLGRSMLLTVTGPPGVGKSILLTRIMNELNSEYEFSFPLDEPNTEHTIAVVKKEVTKHAQTINPNP